MSVIGGPECDGARGCLADEKNAEIAELKRENSRLEATLKAEQNTIRILTQATAEKIFPAQETKANADG